MIEGSGEKFSTRLVDYIQVVNQLDVVNKEEECQIAIIFQLQDQFYILRYRWIGLAKTLEAIFCGFRTLKLG